MEVIRQDGHRLGALEGLASLKHDCVLGALGAGKPTRGSFED